LFSIVLDLTTGPWAEHVRVLVSGVDDPALAALPGAEPLREDHLVSRPEIPTVVVCAGALPPEVLDAVAHGFVVVAGGDTPTARWTLEVERDEVRLLPLGVRLRRHRIPDEAREAIAGVLEAGVRPPVPLRATPAEATSPPWRAMVRVMGPVTVEGAQHPFARRKAQELVVFLACHPGGVDADRLLDALWPDRLVAPATLHTIVSAARSALGNDGTGGPLLPPATPDGTYALGDLVALDAAVFARLVDEAAEAERLGARDAATGLLRDALSFVRGRPFSVANGEYLWVHGEAIGSALVADIGDAAHRLAMLCLETGDARGAWWATGQGLLASPLNEQLHRDRMLAADAAGDPAGVERVMLDLCRAVDVEPAQMHEVLHPLTVETYERLSRGWGVRQALP
ncbi:MAG TPA: BTAD domain-containing putative transcriptional regulator, partial [Acidimicrobiia bacterium]|nr:BTAD domain-containing putative transcriptional regulator [Acidimicrobiia bacterium]